MAHSLYFSLYFVLCKNWDKERGYGYDDNDDNTQFCCEFAENVGSWLYLECSSRVIWYITTWNILPFCSGKACLWEYNEENTKILKIVILLA